MSNGRYILDAKGNPIPEPDLLKWGRWLETADNRRVAHNKTTSGVTVSTVFLGLDHRFGDGPPVLWETMIFGGSHDQYQERYSSLSDAVNGHQKALALATAEEVPQ